MLWENVAQLAFNFAASVGIIFVNKLIFESFQFKFTTMMTVLHYLVTIAGLEILAVVGVYEKRDSPTTPRLVLLSAVVGMAPALNNLSLSLNNLGFYQVVKLLVTPAIVGLESYLYGATMSPPRAAALGLVCVGVAVACVNDVDLSFGGCMAAFCWLPIAAVYKVLWSRTSKEEKWHTLALMRRVLPLATCFLLGLVPLIDPPGLRDFEWTYYRAGMVLLSGVAAFFVNWSGFLVMGACSALAHTVLGQLKACVIILGGWLFFAKAYPPKALAGASLAIVSMVAYTRYNLQEQEAKTAKTQQAASTDATAPVDDASADEAGEALLRGDGRA